jgi:UDP-GlcNAc:undecaprenyl-phosphate GlcNAc-1-phosphate transferase
MYSLIYLGMASFVLSLFLTPVVRTIALRLGLVDQPDDRRKMHMMPIPRLGGVAIFAAVIGTYASSLLFKLSAASLIRTGMPFAMKLLPAVILIFGVGLLDDIIEVRPWQKLGAQSVAAVLAWTGGIRLENIGDHHFSTPLSFVGTLIWVVACSNAVNLIDGVDGLATGVALFATVTTLIAGLLNGNMALAFAAAPLAGALLGFLRYNFNPASIFLGDCGSLTLGFLLGCYGIVWSEKSTTLLSMTAPLLALSIPLLDSCIAVLRRFIRNQPIFGADYSHIHHKLLSRGLTPRRVVLVLYGFCGLGATASLLLTVKQQRYQGFVIVLVCLTVWLGIQHLGYNEFGVAGRMVVDGTLRRVLSAQIALVGFEQELSSATSLKQCWGTLCRSSPQFGFCGVELHVDDSLFYGEVSGSWYVRVDFPGRGNIRSGWCRSSIARD